jgi:hypothetical protein
MHILITTTGSAMYGYDVREQQENQCRCNFERVLNMKKDMSR